MKEANMQPKGWVTIRVKPEEYTKIYNFYRETTCRKLSQYVRNVLLQKPVTVKYRNQSADEILAVLNAIKKELSAIGNNFNQAVHKLHTLDDIAEIKMWAELSESSRRNLIQKTEEIRQLMHKIYDQWLHK